MDAFPSVSKSVPVSAVVNLAAVEEGVLGARNLNSAERRIQSVSHSPLRPKVRLSTSPSHGESLVVSEGRYGFPICKYIQLGSGRSFSTNPEVDDDDHIFPFVCDIWRRPLL